MIIVYGTRFWGRADVIEGVGHTTCRFFHLMFVPLIPIETVFLVSEDRGVKLPFSFKAAMSGWIRGGAILTAIGMGIAAIANFSDGEPLLGIVCGVVAALAVGAFPLAGVIFGGCSPQRKAEIMAAMGMRVEGPGAAQQQPQYQPSPQYAQPPAYPQQPQYGYGQPQVPQGAYPMPSPGYGQVPAFHQPPQQAYPQYPQHPSQQPSAYGAPPAGGFGQPSPYGGPQPPGYGAQGWDPNRR